MNILSLPLQISSLTFYPPLGLWRLTSTDGIIQVLLSSGFQWVWPMEGISGGREKDQRRREREVCLLISPVPSLLAHIGQ